MRNHTFFTFTRTVNDLDDKLQSLGLKAATEVYITRINVYLPYVRHFEECIVSDPQGVEHVATHVYFTADTELPDALLLISFNDFSEILKKAREWH